MAGGALVGGTGQARPVLFALIDELYKSGGPSRVRWGFEKHRFEPAND